MIRPQIRSLLSDRTRRGCVEPSRGETRRPRSDTRCNCCVHDRLSHLRGAAGRYARGTSLHKWIDSLSSGSVDTCWNACVKAERQKIEVFHKVLRELNITNISLLQAFV